MPIIEPICSERGTRSRWQRGRRRVSRASPSSAEASSAEAASSLFGSAILPFDHTGIGHARMCRIMSTGDVTPFVLARPTTGPPSPSQSGDVEPLVHGRDDSGEAYRGRAIGNAVAGEQVPADVKPRGVVEQVDADGAEIESENYFVGLIRDRDEDREAPEQNSYRPIGLHDSNIVLTWPWCVVGHNHTIRLRPIAWSPQRDPEGTRVDNYEWLTANRENARAVDKLVSAQSDRCTHAAHFQSAN